MPRYTKERRIAPFTQLLKAAIAASGLAGTALGLGLAIASGGAPPPIFVRFLLSCALVGSIVGFIPAFFIIRFSNARFQRWQSVPMLAIGAAVGVVAAVVLRLLKQAAADARRNCWRHALGRLDDSLPY